MIEKNNFLTSILKNNELYIKLRCASISLLLTIIKSL